jgi:hypothetical protein
MATATNYVINPLELPSNQAAAALFNQAVIVGTTAQWCSSPYGGATGGALHTSGFPDATVAQRTTAAQAALIAERNARIAQADAIQTSITQLANT